MTERKCAVIAGATGYLGGYVQRVAQEAGYRTRALARDPARLGDAAPDEVFVGQATDPESIAGLFDGADVAFSSIGIRHVRRRPTIWEVDAAANLHLVEAAERAGVRRFVFVSLLGAPEQRHRIPIAEARERVVDRLRKSTMSWAIIRPNGFYNDMLEYLAMARRGRVWLLGDGASRFNPIHGEDLARVCVECFGGQSCVERDVGGPEVVSTREVGELAFAALGTSPRFGRIPAWLIDGLAKGIYPFNNNLGAILSMFHVLHRERELVAPAHGRRSLAPFFRERASRSSSLRPRG